MLLSFARGGEKRIEGAARTIERVGEQVPVGAVDLLDARPHESSELEQADAAAIANVANVCRSAFSGRRG